MPGSHTHPHYQRLKDELRADYHNLDAGCRRFGVTATMFRTAKFVFYISTLLFAVYLIQIAGVDPVIAMAFAALLVSGPEGLETWLMKQGEIERNGSDDDSDT